MRRLALVLIVLGASACSTRAPGLGQGGSPAGPRATGQPPGWIGRGSFAGQREGRPRAYGTGTMIMESADLDRCWDPRLLIRAAENRARASLAKVLGERSETSSTSVAMAEVQRSEAELTWYDGERTIHVLVSAPLAVEIPTPPDEPSGGLRPEALVDALRDTNRARLEASGACADPHRRKELGCCGPIETFCSDPTRFDHRGEGSTCGCGEGPPCLDDFRCEARSGAKRCVCTGKECPCSGPVRCDPKEVCGDGRCY
jgi:hypothetical protein